MAEELQQMMMQALNENSNCLMKHAQHIESNNRNLVQCAQVFEGNPKAFENWIKDVDKHAFLNNSSDKRKQLLSYQLSTGVLLDYIKRYLDSDEGETTWANLKDNLASRFSPIVDKPKAFEMPVSMRQKRDEDIQFYAERLLTLNKMISKKPTIESQLLSVFLSGIWDRDIRAQVERNNPRAFDDAYAIALREQTIMYKCAARKLQPDRLERVDRPSFARDQVPMEIDHARRNYNGRRDVNRHRPNNRYDDRRQI
ncbi:hypothetical protein MAR_019757 [Mya arenaria]|uniref:Retrotransposon gag domain-containing protein n=1 Tax=Mya arenaria TaxID=6604 RepID=A0ABY7E6H3_MYAAR|nr:hypothetical protein MAR_019757 [Mya arenaria]